MSVNNRKKKKLIFELSTENVQKFILEEFMEHITYKRVFYIQDNDQKLWAYYVLKVVKYIPDMVSDPK